MKAKKRFLGQKIQALLSLFPAVAVVGPRQCGKSTLVRDLYPDWTYYDLERPDDYQLISSDPLGFFKRRQNRTIIDESQQYPELFSVLRGVIDDDRDACGRYLLTGSSSSEMVKGLSESLAGRMATVELWPFKAAEFYESPQPAVYSLLADSDLLTLSDIKPVITQNQVYEHWFKGGYPEPRIKDQDNDIFHGLWMDQYFSSYIQRDIQRMFSRINPQVFRLFIQSLSFHSGGIVNHSETARALEISSVTARSYLEILHETFVWRNLRPYEKNSLKKVQKSPKGFFRDQGILHHLLKVSDLDSMLVHPKSGTSFESYVIEEIIRGFQCTLRSGLEFYYYRTRDKSEIDLIIDAPFGLIPIEIKLGHKISKKHLYGLKNFLQETSARFGILVNNADKIEFLTDNIIQIPAMFF